MTTESGSEAPARSGRTSKSKAEPEPTEQDTQEAPALPDMPVSQLIENARAYLGHSSWTAAGALHGHEPDEMMSIDAAKAAIEQWRTTPLDDSEE